MQQQQLLRKDLLGPWLEPSGLLAYRHKASCGQNPFDTRSRVSGNVRFAFQWEIMARPYLARDDRDRQLMGMVMLFISILMASSCYGMCLATTTEQNSFWVPYT